MTLPASISLATAGLALYLVIANANAFAVERWRQRRWFVLLALSAAFYCGPNALLTLDVPPGLLIWCARLSIFAAAVHVVAWAHYAEADLEPLPPRWRLAFDATLLVLGILYSVPGIGLTGQVVTRWAPLLGVVYRVAEPSLWGGFTFGVLVAGLAFTAFRYAAATLRGTQYATAHFIALALLLAAGASDAVVTLRLWQLPYLLDVAFFLAVAVVGIVMSQRWAQDVRALDAAVGARDEFVSVASHELKSPLTAARLQVEVLQHKLRSARGIEPEAAAAELGNTLRAIDRLVRLVNQLLDVSRIDAGRLALEPEPTELSAIAREVVARLDPTAARVRLRTAGEFPGNWDRLRIEQVLTNLVDNALKYGAGKPVDVELDATLTELAITVRDQGIGIAPEDQARLFTRFHRTAEARPYQGFGLGLYITRQIVSALGGGIEVASQPNRGATFIVRLPRAAQKA